MACSLVRVPLLMYLKKSWLTPAREIQGLWYLLRACDRSTGPTNLTYQRSSASLLGITLIQGWIYMNNNHDRWYSRLFVSPPKVVERRSGAYRDALGGPPRVRYHSV